MAAAAATAAVKQQQQHQKGTGARWQHDTRCSAAGLTGRHPAHPPAAYQIRHTENPRGWGWRWRHTKRCNNNFNADIIKFNKYNNTKCCRQQCGQLQHHHQHQHQLRPRIRLRLPNSERNSGRRVQRTQMVSEKLMWPALRVGGWGCHCADLRLTLWMHFRRDSSAAIHTCIARVFRISVGWLPFFTSRLVSYFVFCISFVRQQCLRGSSRCTRQRRVLPLVLKRDGGSGIWGSCLYPVSRHISFSYPTTSSRRLARFLVPFLAATLSLIAGEMPCWLQAFILHVHNNGAYELQCYVSDPWVRFHCGAAAVGGSLLTLHSTWISLAAGRRNCRHCWWSAKSYGLESRNILRKLRCASSYLYKALKLSDIFFKLLRKSYLHKDG